jgi:hypothetical protein
MSLSDQKTEVRFAVVMYGGVSLAIYMNGIAEEMLRMVRATATRDAEHNPLIPYDELDAVEQVYRKIACCHGDARADCAVFSLIPCWNERILVGCEPKHSRLVQGNLSSLKTSPMFSSLPASLSCKEVARSGRRETRFTRMTIRHMNRIPRT